MQMKRFILTIALVSSAMAAGAQTSIEEVLRSVEANNKELQANRQMVTAQKLEAKLDNNLPDPSVSYTHQYGNKGGMGIQGELVASQSFDFPTVYVQKNKLSKAKGETFAEWRCQCTRSKQDQPRTAQCKERSPHERSCPYGQVA